MFEISGLEVLAFLVPLLGYPVLIMIGLIVEAPVLRREPAMQRRRTASTVLAIISLVAAAPLLVTAWALGAFGMVLLGALVVPAVMTLVRLRQPRVARQLCDGGTSWEYHLIVDQPHPPRPRTPRSAPGSGAAVVVGAQAGSVA